MMQNLLVSIVIPSYNRGSVVRDTLESLTSQSWSRWECIIVDDGSTDETGNVVKFFAQKDERFRFFKRAGQNNGANVCRNQGAAKASGEYIVFLDSDDLLAPGCLEGRVRDMEVARQYDFGVYMAELFSREIGDRKVLWNIADEQDELDRFLNLEPVWQTTAPIWRREAWRRSGGFDEELLSYQDWEFHTRVLIQRPTYYVKPVRDYFYRHCKEGKAQGAISSVSGVSREHLQCHEGMVFRVHALLKSRGMLNNNFRNRVAGQYWWLAGRWRRQGEMARARTVWRKAFEEGLVASNHYRQGRLLLWLQRIRGGGRVAPWFQQSWPKTFYNFGSKKLHSVPISYLARLREKSVCGGVTQKGNQHADQPCETLSESVSTMGR